MKELTVLVFLSILILPFVVSDDNGRVLQIISVVNGMFVPDMDNIRTVFDQISPQTEIGVVSIPPSEYRKRQVLPAQLLLAVHAVPGRT